MLNTWQNIEATSPKNGVHILVEGVARSISDASGIMVARFKDGRWLSWPGDFVTHPVRWAPIPEDWR